MIISRVLPTLIKLNRLVNFNTFAKTQLSNPASLSEIKLFPEIRRKLEVKTMTTDVEKDLNDPKRHFNYEQLIEKKNNSDVVIIDVREDSEIQETGKIPGSIHIPLAQLGKALGEMSQQEFKKQYNADKPEKDKEVIFSCKAGGRSYKALKLGLEVGYSKAGHYKGGWLDWAEKTAQLK